jgi:low affinity Fe/Cu permease
MNGWKGMIWTLGLVFVVACATQFLALGGDVFNTSLSNWQIIVNSGVAALLAFAVNYLAPNITRYGIGSK